MMWFRTIMAGWMAVLAFSCAAAEARLSEARTALEKWVETRQLVSRAKADWQTDKESLEQTLKMFERELRSVEEQMSKISTNNAQVEKERAQAEALRASSGGGLEAARHFADAFEPQLVKTVPQLPVPLQEILKPLLNRIPADPSQTRMTVPERAQVLVGILNEFDKFNNAISVFSEKRKNDKGEEMAVETVYCGLGAAYFVNGSGDFAGTGVAGKNGWEWTIKSDLAPSVRELIRIYRNERPARFINLPVVIR